jgi:class 3 adenylate cyclase
MAQKAAEAGTGTPEMNYIEVLALARMGDDSRAIEQYKRYGMDKTKDVDTLALWARLQKDIALASQPDERSNRLWEAAEFYHSIYERTGGYFPLINAATLAAAAGRSDEARQRAETVLGHPQIRIGADYWSAVTQAEALLLLGREREAVAAAREAAVLPEASIGARSSTVRQLEDVFPLIQPDRASYEPVLTILRPPPVLHFCGHIFQADEAAEARLSRQIDDALDRLGANVGYGALAAGADILIAERILERGGELHVVLPFRQSDFVSTSVAPAGAGWVERFDRCLSRASSTRSSTEMPYVGDHRQFSYGARVAMGLSALRAAHQSTHAVQLAVWDGADRGLPAGTAVDVRFWTEHGRTCEIIPAGEIRRATPVGEEVRANMDERGPERAAHALLFADFAGFSKIPEHLLPSFWSEVMTRAAKVIDGAEPIVLNRGTWGDAIYLVIDGALGAANLALSLQEELGTADFNCLDCGPAGMRIAVHYGPIYRSTDPITRKEIYFGTEVSRTARLEPITPTGSVYVTEPFAALVALEGKGAFRLHNAGTLALAKGYGAQPVYRLARPGAAVSLLKTH